MKTRVLLSFLLICHHVDARLKTIVFYPKWCEVATGSVPYSIEPNDMDWRGFDYVVHFWSGENVQSTIAPYFTLLTSSDDSIDAETNGISAPACGPSCWKPYQRQLIDSVHAAGGKCLIDIHQVNNQAFLDLLPDSSKTEVMIYNIVKYCERKGYDGVCVDIEWWQTNEMPKPAEMSRMTRRFRFWLNQMPAGRGVLSYAPSMYDYESYEAVVDTAVDFYAIQGNYAQAWGGSANVNWFGQPLRKPNLCPGAETHAWAEFLPNWINSGHSTSRMMPLVSASGGVNIGTNTTCGNITTQEGDGYYMVYDWLLLHGGTLYWNDVAKQHYITGTATAGDYFGGNVTINSGDDFWTSYDDSMSIYAKVVWLDSNSYAGIGSYSISTELDFDQPRGKKNVVSSKMLEIVGAIGGPQSQPPIPVLTSPANGATNVELGTSLRWNASTSATSYHLQVSTVSNFDSVVINQSGITGTSYAASGLSNKRTYCWHVNATNAGGTSDYSSTWSFTTAGPTSVEQISSGALTQHALFQNYPNPFNSATTIEFALTKSAFTTLRVYNSIGSHLQTLVGGNLPPGRYRVHWGGLNFPSGVYFYRIQAGEFIETKKLILLR